MSKSTRRLLPAYSLGLWLAPLVLCVAPIEPQESTFSDAVQVELVEVDALVTDGDGRPVLDLSIDDFQLFDNGQPVQITHFESPGGARRSTVPTAESAEAGPAPSGSSQAPPRMVIFLDERHLALRSRHLVFARLQDVLVSGLPPETEVMLASYTGSVEVLAPFTRNRKEMVNLIAERFSGAVQATSDRVQVESLMRRLPGMIEVMLSPPDAMENACSGASGVVRGHASQVLGGVEATIAALGQFVRSLSAYPGPKSLLYVSDGLPLVAGQEVYDYLIELCDGSLLASSADPTLRALAALEPAKSFPSRARMEMLEFSTHDLWDALAAEANTRRVTLNTVQASGLEPSRRSTVDGAAASSMTERFGQRNRQEPLVVMAEETGGRSVLNTNNVAPAVGELIDLDSARYVLAFTSDHPADGATHRLRLELSRPDLDVRYRRSYKSRSPDERVADGVLASLHHGFEDNAHDLRVEAAWLDDGKVALDIRVPLRSLVLLPEGDESRGLFTVFIAALDASGLGSGIRRKSVAIRVTPGETRKTHTVQTTLDLKRLREPVVAVAVRDELGNTASFTKTKVRRN